MSTCGAFGCDSYDISQVSVGGRGSNGALHGLTKFSVWKMRHLTISF